MVTRYIYAELDESNKVKCLLDTDKEVSSPTLIAIESMDHSLFGRAHLGDGVFSDTE